MREQNSRVILEVDASNGVSMSLRSETHHANNYMQRIGEAKAALRSINDALIFVQVIDDFDPPGIHLCYLP